MNSQFAARLFALLILVAVLFQVALASGAPWGELAWGGNYSGQLPHEMRFASALSALLLLLLGAVVLSCAGVMLPRWQRFARKLIWFVVAYCALAVLANAITPSVWERVIWLPVTATLLATSIVVARRR